MKYNLFLGAFLIFLGTGSLRAEAFFVASEPAQLKSGVATDVFIAGFGNDQGDQFLKTALLGAKVSRDRFPQRQRVIISAVNESLESERSLLEEAGLSLRKEDRQDLDKETLVQSLRQLDVPVTSLQFFGHANTYNGFRLQSKTDRLDEKTAEFKDIGKVLAPNAIVVFNSCNSGWFLAPAAAKLWNRPVFGSFSSADFQEPMNDGNWYYHDVGLFPEGLSRIGETSLILRSSLTCNKGQCLRLKPVNSAYVDDFGKFEKGLGFFKVFSPDESLIPAGLIHYTLLTPSVTPLSLQSNRTEMLKVIVDWMCPSDKSGSKRAACEKAILNQEFKTNRKLNFFSGDPVACTNTGCSTTVKCSAIKAVFGASPCKTKEIEDKDSTVFSDQMEMIFKGLDLFERGELNLNQ